MAYETLVFKRGYLITSEKFDASDNPTVSYLTANWENKKINSLFVYFAPGLGAYTYEGQQTKIMLLGMVLDPLNTIDCPKTILQMLHDKYLRSEDDFFDYVDTLSGRFIILVVSPSKRFVFQDATGNKSLFYDHSSHDIFISSHAQLIAEMSDYEIPRERKEFISSESYKRDIRYLPGILTPYPDIYILTPNTLLDLDALQVKRFYPREKVGEQKISLDLIDEVSHLFTKQVQMLCKKRKLSVSLTAGIDSRLTLAATRKFKDSIFYYTFAAKGNSEHEKDTYYAQKICNDLKIEHHLFSMNESPVSEDDWEFLKVFRRNTAYMRADSQGMLAKALSEKYPEDYLHVKSNCSEIARASYRRNLYFAPKNITPLKLSKLYGTNPSSMFCLNAFRDFIEMTDFKKNSIFDYDFYDLFHWEHKMGTWQSLQILDLDMSQDTYILYNNRYILEKMLSVSFEDRVQSRLHYEIIRYLWPEALRIPCNPWQARDAKGFIKKMKKLAKGFYLRFDV